MEGNSIIQVLIFINSYMSDNFMGSAELAISKDKLPDLLDPTQQEKLVDQYFAKTKTDMAKWLDRSLASETELWLKVQIAYIGGRKYAAANFLRYFIFLNEFFETIRLSL